MPDSPVTSGAGVPAASEAVANALGSVRADGLEPDAAGSALPAAVASGELSTDEAVERALAIYAR